MTGSNKYRCISQDETNKALLATKLRKWIETLNTCKAELLNWEGIQEYYIKIILYSGTFKIANALN